MFPSTTTATAPAATSAGLSIEAGSGVYSMDEVEVLPIGSGGEVGRSCVILRYKGRSVMFDCGNHPAKSGLDSLPFFDSIKCDEIDVVLITHFHLDHCGALPFLCNQTSFKGRVFMTSATMAFYKMVMNDFIRVGAGASDLVTKEWLENTMQRIETVEFHEELMVDGIHFQPFNAGHVLGAAMFSVDIAGMRALYTGDFSRVPDRHLLGAEVPPLSPDILIAESTNGIRELESREERESTFTSSVHAVVKRGGRCLVPVFALGRAQELLLILEEYWEEHKELQSIPIYYASSLAQRCMKLYQNFVSAMNDRVKQQHANNRNPFNFKYIHAMMETASFEDRGPCVVLASPGMLQSGLSLELFERWCGDKRNGIIMAGYCVDGTIAKDVLSRPREVMKPDGKMLQVRMGTIEAVSFSAHSDGRQTRDFIQQLPRTQHTILVHGNAGAMAQLKGKLQQDFRDRDMKVYTTTNQVAIRIPFVQESTAKVMGRLASKDVAPGSFVSGVMLVSGNQNYNIVHPDDVPFFTDVAITRIEQAMVLPLPCYKTCAEVLQVLQSYFAASAMLAEVRPAVEERDGAEVIGVVPEGVRVEVLHEGAAQTTLTIAWTTSHYNDLVADVTCIALARLAEDGSDTGRAEMLLPVDVAGRDRLFRIKCFHHMMSQFYGNVKTNLLTGTCAVELADGQRVSVRDCIEINLEADGPKKTAVDYGSAEVLQLKANLKRIYLTLFPIPVDSGWCDCGMLHDDKGNEEEEQEAAVKAAA